MKTALSACICLVSAIVLGACADDGTTPPAAAARACPGPSSEHERGWYHSKATKVAAYVLGGEDPFADGDTKDAAACDRARACTGKLRAQVASGSVDVTRDEPTESCGGPASTLALNGVGLDEAAACNSDLDACWGAGVSGLFLAEESMRDGKVHIDPEPANLGEPLGSTTGVTAAAVYIYSHDPTQVLEWPATFLSGASVVPGTPCSTAPLPSGAITSKVILALTDTSPMRRCA